MIKFIALFLLMAAIAAAQLTPPPGGSGNATQLQGRALASTAPSDTNTVCWDASGSTWKPCAAGSGGTPGTPLNSYQYDSAGSFGGSNILAYDGTNRRNVMSQAAIEFDQIADPTTAPTAALIAMAGNIDAGTHAYCVAFVSVIGLTNCGPPSNLITSDAGHGRVSLTSIPTGPSGTTARNIYRTSADTFAEDSQYLLATLADNTTTTYTDNLADSFGATPSINTTAGGELLGSGRIFYKSLKGIRMGNGGGSGITDNGLSYTVDPFILSMNYTNAGYTGGNNPVSIGLLGTNTINAFTGNDVYYGLQLTGVSSGTGNLNTHVGLQVFSQVIPTGTIGTHNAISVQYAHFGGTVTNANLISIETPFGSAAASTMNAINIPALSGLAPTQAGIRIGNISGGATNNFAIKTGLGLVSFGDHIASTGTAPGISGCGTSATLDANATDAGGTITFGTSPGTCVVTFAASYVTNPKCNLTFQSPTVLPSYSHTATAITIAATGASGSFDYLCQK